MIDDDDSLRRALGRAIRLAGYDVQAFRSADEFARVGGCNSRDCLVLDVNLPGTSGIEFRNALAAAGANPPTIFITALDCADTDETLTALAPVAVLHKPFTNDDLMHAIGLACRPDS